VSRTLLSRLGEVTVLDGDAIATGAQSVMIDLPPPQPQQGFRVDGASALMMSTIGGPVCSLDLSGFYIVSAGRPPVNDPADNSLALADLLARSGVKLSHETQDLIGSSGAAFGYFGISFVGPPVLVPYGYKLRFIWARYGPVPLVGDTLSVSVIGRMFSYCDPCME